MVILQHHFVNLGTFTLSISMDSEQTNREKVAKPGTESRCFESWSSASIVMLFYPSIGHLQLLQVEHLIQMAPIRSHSQTFDLPSLN